jgi:hypothetical protein
MRATPSLLGVTCRRDGVCRGDPGYMLKVLQKHTAGRWWARTGLRVLVFGDCNCEVLEEGRAVKVGGITDSSVSSGSTMRLVPDGEPMAGFAGEGRTQTGGGGRGGGLGGFGGGGKDAAVEDMMSYIKDMEYTEEEGF